VNGRDSMSERKHKRETEEIIELGTEETGFLLEPAHVELGSGYTLAIDYDENDKPVIDVKTYGEVNMTHVRREISKIFPDARIRQLAQTNVVTLARKTKKKRKIKRR